LIKGYYLYVPLVFAISFLFLALVLGLHIETKKLFDAYKGDLRAVSVSAVQSAFSDIYEATGGVDLRGEFIPNVAEVIATQVDEAAFQVMDDAVLEEIVSRVRYSLKLSLKSALEGDLNALFPRKNVIPADDFYEAFQSNVLNSFKNDYYPNFCWEGISSQYDPMYLHIFWKTFLFLFPVFFEVSLFLLFLRKMEKQRTNKPLKRKNFGEAKKPMSTS
jgi:hypothetical protein